MKTLDQGLVNRMEQRLYEAADLDGEDLAVDVGYAPRYVKLINTTTLDTIEVFRTDPVEFTSTGVLRRAAAADPVIADSNVTITRNGFTLAGASALNTATGPLLVQVIR